MGMKNTGKNFTGNASVTAKFDEVFCVKAFALNQFVK